MHTNGFTEQFGSHIKFVYSFFDRLIIRGYIQGMFSTGNVITLLRNLGFNQHTNGISPEVGGLDVFESAINSIHNGLSAIYQQLNIAV